MLPGQLGLPLLPLLRGEASRMDWQDFTRGGHKRQENL